MFKLYRIFNVDYQKVNLKSVSVEQKIEIKRFNEYKKAQV